MMRNNEARSTFLLHCKDLVDALRLTSRDIKNFPGGEYLRPPPPLDDCNFSSIHLSSYHGAPRSQPPYKQNIFLRHCMAHRAKHTASHTKQ